jgi:hypothetical protein
MNDEEGSVYRDASTVYGDDLQIWPVMSSGSSDKATRASDQLIRNDTEH